MKNKDKQSAPLSRWKCMFLLSLLLFIGDAYGQQRLSLADAVKQIEQRFKANLSYEHNLLDGKYTQADALKGQKIEEVLKQVLYPNQLVFLYIDENSFTIVKRTDHVADRSKSGAAHNSMIASLRGRIRNSSGAGISDASIQVVGTTRGVKANADGTFEIQHVDAGDTLLISALGYFSKKFRATGQQDLDITLEDNINVLEEVVVSTGYQQISKERSAGAFAKPDMQVVNERNNSMNILDRLDGLAPGLTVNGSGRGEELTIRGVTSINASRAPLVVVDGIAMSMTDVAMINPNDVADVSVLKDATATSIWGARASNGVIVITTKKGNTGEKLKIGYNAFMKLEGRPDLTYLPKLNSQQVIEASRSVFDPVNNTWGDINTPNSSSFTGLFIAPHEIPLYQNHLGKISDSRRDQLLDSLSGLSNLDHIRDTWYRSAYLMNHTLSLSGGSERYSFYGSGAFTDDKSTGPKGKDRTYKVNLRQDFKVNKYLSTYVIADLTNIDRHTVPTLAPSNSLLPYIQYTDGQGKGLDMGYLNWPDSIRQVYETKSKIALDYNPINEMNYSRTDVNQLRARLVGGLRLDLWKGVRFEGTYGLTRGTARTETLRDQESYAVRLERAQFTTASKAYLPTTGAKFYSADAQTKNWTVRNQLVFDRSFGRHALTTLLGHEAQASLQKGNYNTVWGYKPDLLTSYPVDLLTLADGIQNPIIGNSGISRSVLFTNNVTGVTELEDRIVSYYANAGYTFDNKYTLNASWRIDESSLFGRERAAQNRPVWSTGVAWKISRENFWTLKEWFNTLSIRSTVGVTGNAPSLGTAASNDIIASSSNSIFPGGLGVNIVTPANRSLTWESTFSVNTGIDFAFLNNRLSGSFDWYTKNTKDLIGFMQTNPFTGYSGITGNLGDMKNKGVELALHSKNIANDAFSWGTTLNLSYNRNTITKLNRATAIRTGAGMIGEQFVEGYDAFALFAYRYAGLDVIGDPQVYQADGTITKEPNITLADDVAFQGTVQPIWNGGFSNRFRYKSLSLSANAIFNFGQVMRRPNLNTLWTGGRILTNVSTEFLDRWQQAGDEAKTDIPAYVDITSQRSNLRNTNYYTQGDRNVMSASFIKLRDITLAYQLPTHVAKRLYTQGISVRTQMNNIMLWKNNKYGVDPEIGSGLYFGQHALSFGVQVDF